MALNTPTAVSWEEWAGVHVRMAGAEYAYRMGKNRVEGSLFGYFRQTRRWGRKILTWHTVGYGWVVPGTVDWDEPVAVLNTGDVIHYPGAGSATLCNAYGLSVVGTPTKFCQILVRTSDGCTFGHTTPQLYQYKEHLWSGVGQRRAVKEVLWRETVAQRFV